MKAYIACFDISDDKVRYRVAKILGGFGNRVQKSVFEIAFKSNAQLQRTRVKIDKLLEEGDDCRFYHLCGNCRALSTGNQGESIADYPAAYIV